jgi:hypothetical protein
MIMLNPRVDEKAPADDLEQKGAVIDNCPFSTTDSFDARFCDVLNY